MCWNNWLVGIPGIILQYWAGSGKKAGIQKDERNKYTVRRHSSLLLAAFLILFVASLGSRIRSQQCKCKCAFWEDLNSGNGPVNVCNSSVKENKANINKIAMGVADNNKQHTE